MINSYPNTFAVVEYHVGSGDPYVTPWGSARGVFYNIWSDGVPWFAYDGLWDAWPISTYVSKFLSRQAVPTPVTMQVGALQISGNTYRIQIRVCLEPGGSPLNLRTYAVIVEDHYPASPTYSRNTFRAATATSDFALPPGACYFETRDITLDPTWKQSNLGIIAWAQVPATQYPAEVYQAAKDLWPFEALVTPGDLNCDGLVNFADINPFVLALGGYEGYHAQYPDCNWYNADCNLDGQVNYADINPFVALLSASE